MKLIHVLSAVIAVGLSISYGFWQSAARTKEQRLFAASFIRRLDMRVATPAYVVALITGIGTQHMMHIPTGTLWIAGSLGLWVVAMGVAHGFMSPTLRRLVSVLESKGVEAPEVAGLSARLRVGGLALTVVTFVIIALMVLKPSTQLF